MTVWQNTFHVTFRLFYCWAHLPSCSCPIQGHSYCPLLKSVRSCLTQILFLPKWDFYCFKGAASWIWLSQPFPVSSRRGSAALLRPVFLPHLLWDKSGALVAKWSLHQPRMKSFPQSGMSSHFETNVHTQTHRIGSDLFENVQQTDTFTNKADLMVHPIFPHLSDQACRCVLTCFPKVKHSHGASARRLFVSRIK